MSKADWIYTEEETSLLPNSQTGVLEECIIGTMTTKGQAKYTITADAISKGLTETLRSSAQKTCREGLSRQIIKTLLPTLKAGFDLPDGTKVYILPGIQDRTLIISQEEYMETVE